MRVGIWAPKGGSGASVVVAAVAVVLADGGASVRVVDLAGDQRAYFGLPDDGAIGERATAAPGIEIWTASAAEYGPEGNPVEHTVIDAGLAAHADERSLCVTCDRVLMVTRACYVSLRRAVRHPTLARTDGVIVLEEPGRALKARDVADVIGIPVVGRIPAHESIARAADAGVLAVRPPEMLRRSVRRALVACHVMTSGHAA